MHDRKLLAIDIGNSNIVFGLFEGRRLKWHRRSATEKGVTPLGKIRLSGLDGVVVSSVVPQLDRPFRSVLKRKFGVEPFFVSSAIDLPIKIKVKKPWEVGADRIANAVAAYCSDLTPYPPLLIKERGKKGGEVSKGIIVIDFGTATTFDVISAKGEYLGGPIAPGIGIANAALHEKTAKLPLAEIARPARVIGKETVACIQSGVFYGYAGLVDGLVERIRRESDKKMKVIATGGLASVIANDCKTIDFVDPFLTLKGLRTIYEYHVQRTSQDLRTP